MSCLLELVVVGYGYLGNREHVHETSVEFSENRNYRSWHEGKIHSLDSRGRVR